MFSFREHCHQEEKRAIECSRAENQGRCWQWIDILAALKDADTLRSDPMLKTVCDQLPESDPDLATQPTFSRLENSVTKKDLMRLSRWLLGRYGALPEEETSQQDHPGSGQYRRPHSRPTGVLLLPRVLPNATFCILC